MKRPPRRPAGRDVARHLHPNFGRDRHRRIDEIDDALSEEAETSVYRIVQEAVNNIIKHSQATEASLVVRRQGRELTLAIRDNGVGFSGSWPAAATDVQRRQG